MAWRYYIQRPLTNAWLDRDVPLERVQINWALSGPGSMTAHIDAYYAQVKSPDDIPIFEEWSTIVYAELDDQIRWAGILESSVDAGNGERDLTFVSFSGYPKGRVFTGDQIMYQADAFDLIRYLWTYVQSDDYSGLDVQVAGGQSGVIIGNEEPGPQPVRNDTESADSYSQRLIAWQTKRDTPYELAWYNTPDIGNEIDSLIQESGSEYVELHQWTDDTKQSAIHMIFLYRPNAEVPNLGNPTAAPSIAAGWGFTTWAQNPSSGNAYGGLTGSYTDGNESIVAQSEFSDGLRSTYSIMAIDKRDGHVKRRTSINSQGSYQVMGVCAVQGYYAVLFRLGIYYFIECYDMNLTRVSSVIVGIIAPRVGQNYRTIPFAPTIGRDTVNDRAIIAWADGSNGIDAVYLDSPFGHNGFQRKYPQFNNIGGSRLGFVERGTFDFGAIRMVFGIADNAIYVTDDNGDRLGDSQIFSAAFGGSLVGGTWDGAKFITLDSYRRFCEYTSFNPPGTSGVNVPITASYSWYDSNPVGTTHESLSSERTTINAPRRSYIDIRTPKAPEAWNAFSSDAAKDVRLYVSTSYNQQTLYRTMSQSMFGSDSQWLTQITSTPVPSGVTPPSRNSFEDIQAEALPTGSRRLDLRFVEGENIVVPPLPQRNGESYGNYVIAIGAGSDRALYYEITRRDGRLRRDIVLPLKDTTDPTRLQLTAQNYLDIVQNISTFDTIVVAEHPNAPIGSWTLGDEIFVQTFSSFDKVNGWAKITGWSIDTDTADSATINVIRII